MKTGIELIAEERQRQVEVEGWDSNHDVKHDNEELSRAACVYAKPEMYRRYAEKGNVAGLPEGHPYEWPFEKKWFKPTPDDRIRELVKAGALIAAEIDRLQNQQG